MSDKKTHGGCYGSGRHGFTHIELMIAVVCMAILLTPVFLAFRSGTKTALRGMVKVEITVEAKTLLRQVHDDLKYSTFYIDYSAPVNESTSDFFDKIVSSSDGTMFTLLRFPLRGSVSEAIITDDGAARRMPVRIIYELKKQDSGLHKLYRQEGNLPPVLLSSRVNFFEIRENPAAPAKTSWLVNLQLANLSQQESDDLNAAGAQAAGPETSAGERYTNRSQSVQLADFFAVVSSEYYSRFRRSNSIPNWHTLITHP